MAILVGIPLLGLLAMLQSVIVSRMPLLFGTADVVLLTLLAWALHDRVRTAWIWALIGGLMISFLSALPSFTPLWGYLIAIGVARLLRHRVWQTPFLSMLLATFLGTIIVHLTTLVAMQFEDIAVPLQTSLNLIMLPSILLNLVLALPVFALINDLANTLHPAELEA